MIHTKTLRSNCLSKFNAMERKKYYEQTQKNRLHLKMMKNTLDISLFVLRFRNNNEEDEKKKNH